MFDTYDGDAISPQEMGVMMDDQIDLGNDFVRSKVRRSNNLKCSTCGARLPMGSRAIFELSGGTFVGVHCDKNDEVHSLAQFGADDTRHPMDLED